MPIVTMPDGKVVDLPAQLPPEDVALLDKIHGAALADEVGRVLDKTIRGGATALPRFLKSVADMAADADTKMQEEHPVFEFFRKGIQNSPTGRVTQLYELLRKGGGDKVLDKAMTPSEPKTEIGKAVGNIGEATVGTLLSPGGMVHKGASIVQGMASGAGGELAARLTGDSPIARVLGAILGGGVAAAGSSVKPKAEKLLRQAVSEVPEADWRRAKVLTQTLKDNGIPHLASQTLGGKSTLADLVSVASTHPTVRPSLMAAVENAPEKAQKAFNVWGAKNLPVGIDETKTVLNDVQQAATDRIGALTGKGRAAYGAELPAGTSSSTYSPDEVMGIAKTLKETSLDPSTFGPGTAGEGFLSGVISKLEALASNKSTILNAQGQANSLPVPKGYVNNILKDLNQFAMKEGYSGVALGEAKTALRAATPEFQPARDAMSKVITEEVNPAKKGLIGQLAEMGGGVKPDKATAKTTALNLVFPADVRQPEAIRELGKQLGGEGVGELLREHLSRSMEKAVRLSSEAGKTQQPFEFLKTIAGTNAQRQNLEAALQTSSEAMGANPAAVRNGFYKLMKAFETSKDLKLPASVDRGVLQQQAGLNLPGLLVAPQSRLGRVLWEGATEKTFKKIADMVMAPDGLKQLEALAKTQDPSIIGRYAASLLSSVDKIEAADPAQPAP